MATVLQSVFPTEWTVADMLTHLGGIPLERIRMATCFRPNPASIGSAN